MMAAAAPATGATSLDSMHVKNITPASGVRSATPLCPQFAMKTSIATVPVEAIAKACRRSQKKVLGLVCSLVSDRLIGEHEYVLAYSTDGSAIPGSCHLTESGVLKVIPLICGRKTQTERLKLVNRLFRTAVRHSELDRLDRTPDWQRNRTAGKAARQALGEVVKEFVDYATKQGSDNANRYYGNITRAIYMALLPSINSKQYDGLRDTLSDRQLGHLATAESIAEYALTRGMAQELNYKEIFVELKQRLHAFVCMLPEIEPADRSSRLPAMEAA